MSLNTRELFDTVKTHLLTQKKKSYNARLECMYRSGELRCAVGCLITDKHYTPRMEGNNLAEPAVQDIVSDSIGRELTATDIRILKRLQEIHDTVRVSEWEQEINELEAQETKRKDL